MLNLVMKVKMHVAVAVRGLVGGGVAVVVHAVAGLGRAREDRRIGVVAVHVGGRAVAVRVGFRGDVSVAAVVGIGVVEIGRAHV